MRMLWLGAQYQDPDGTGDAASPAAMTWQRHLTDALLVAGVDLAVVGHTPRPSWPNGPLRDRNGGPRRAADDPPSRGSYWNLRGVRLPLLAQAYLEASQEAWVEGPYEAVATYNAYPYLAAAAALVQRRRSVPWVLVRADGVRTELLLGRLPASGPAAAVYLSWKAYQDADIKPSLYLEGGIDAEAAGCGGEAHGDKHVVLYAGSSASYTGFPQLLQAAELVQRPDVEIWACGKHNPADIPAELDDRVKVLGFLGEKDLIGRARQACAFINPRPPDMLLNAENFPSKLLFYLRFGAPVISTRTPGLPPHYSEVLRFADTPREMAAAIDGLAAACRTPIYDRQRSRIEEFARHHSWGSAAAAFSEFIGSVVREWGR